MKTKLKSILLLCLVAMSVVSCNIFSGENEEEDNNELVLCNKLGMDINFWKSSLGLSSAATLEEATFLIGERSCASVIRDGDNRYNFEVGIDITEQSVADYKRQLTFASNASKIADFDPNLIKENSTGWVLVQNNQLVIMKFTKFKNNIAVDENKNEQWLKKMYEQVKSKL